MESIEDREEWDREWQSMEYRRIEELSFPKTSMDFDPEMGELLSATIAKAPPQHIDRLYFRNEECPICSESTMPENRIAASLYPIFGRLKGLGFSVWCHPACFESLPLSDDPTHFPW
ncbi:hypothetical protein BH10ACI3_BH10ACI3_09400 [soil metagenome]